MNDSEQPANVNNNVNLPGELLPYPKYESSCHGAPVKKLNDQAIKYYCTECSQPCIARSKK